MSSLQHQELPSDVSFVPATIYLDAPVMGEPLKGTWHLGVGTSHSDDQIIVSDGENSWSMKPDLYKGSGTFRTDIGTYPLQYSVAGQVIQVRYVRGDITLGSSGYNGQIVCCHRMKNICPSNCICC